MLFRSRQGSTLGSIFRDLEKLGRAERAVGDRLEDVCADRAARLPAIDASKIVDGTKNRRSALAG